VITRSPPSRPHISMTSGTAWHLAKTKIFQPQPSNEVISDHLAMAAAPSVRTRPSWATPAARQCLAHRRWNHRRMKRRRRKRTPPARCGRETELGGRRRWRLHSQKRSVTWALGCCGIFPVVGLAPIGRWRTNEIHYVPLQFFSFTSDDLVPTPRPQLPRKYRILELDGAPTRPALSSSAGGDCRQWSTRWSFDPRTYVRSKRFDLEEATTQRTKEISLSLEDFFNSGGVNSQYRWATRLPPLSSSINPTNS
jgi:hypothetical protein